MTKEEFNTVQPGDNVTFMSYFNGVKEQVPSIGRITKVDRENEILFITEYKTHLKYSFHFSHAHLLHW